MLCCFWCLYIISLCYIFNLYILTSYGVFRILSTNVYETEKWRNQVPLFNPQCLIHSQNRSFYKTRPGRRHNSFRHTIGWKCSVSLRHDPPLGIKLRKSRWKVRRKKEKIEESQSRTEENEEQRVLRLMEWESGRESLKMAGEDDEMEEKGPNKDRKRRRM